jgi:hypothetical protein
MLRPLFNAVFVLLTLTAGAGFFAFNEATGTGISKAAAFVVFIASVIALVTALKLAYLGFAFID